MDYTYYFAGDSNIAGALIALTVNFLTSGGFALLTYTFRSLALYSIAKRRGLRHPWMAWVPVVDLWLLGCIADQYQYVVKGRNKSRRKVLLTLNILTVALTSVVSVMAVSSIVGLVSGAMAGMSEPEIFSAITGLLLGAVGLALPLAVLGITLAVFRFIALYDLYCSCVPQNATLFLVLSILFNVTEPFFLFFSRNKDEGMPPRRPEPSNYYQPEPEPTYQEPWNQGE